MNIINIKYLEQLLTSNWSVFLNKTKVLSEVLQCLRDKELPVIQKSNLPNQKGIQISVSRMEIHIKGYLIWIEFSIPKDNQISCGTLELLVSHNGDILQKDAIGHILQLSEIHE